MRIVYSPRYAVDIGPHVFPTLKYRMVYARLGGREPFTQQKGSRSPFIEFVAPEPASWDELALVHTTEYLAKMRQGTLSHEDITQLELPWSEQMVEGFRTMVGGTTDAACFACGVARIESRANPESPTPNPVVCHLGGGLHHAFPNHGEGFCPFNDVAVAVRALQSRGVERVAIVDLDVHHGNGTAFIFESDDRVFTFSMHQQYNYPMWKPRGSLDIGLPDGAADATFLQELEGALPKVMASRPECVFYLAGADPYEHDQLGGLRLTKDGLRRRDRMVIATVRAAGVPLVITLAGGYARRVDDTVDIHVATIEEAAGS
jgi:acetoin utilization deacetylase AcuC-like enzyme